MLEFISYNLQNESWKRQIVLKIREREEFVLRQGRTTLITGKRSGMQNYIHWAFCVLKIAAENPK